MHLEFQALQPGALYNQIDQRAKSRSTTQRRIADRYLEGDADIPRLWDNWNSVCLSFFYIFHNISFSWFSCPFLLPFWFAGYPGLLPGFILNFYRCFNLIPDFTISICGKVLTGKSYNRRPVDTHFFNLTGKRNIIFQ